MKLIADFFEKNNLQQQCTPLECHPVDNALLLAVLLLVPDKNKSYLLGSLVDNDRMPIVGDVKVVEPLAEEADDEMVACAPHEACA